MRQYTNKEQTQHLIELGFPEPKIIANTEVEELPSGITHLFTRYDYSIGELISFLVNPIIEGQPDAWIVNYDSGIKHLPPFIEDELIDALYKACVELKNKGVI